MSNQPGLVSVEVKTTQPVMDALVAVAKRSGLDPLTAKLLDIRRWLGDDLELLEQAMGDIAKNGGIAGNGSHGVADDLAKRAARHLLSRTGKRIRPICVLLAARLGGRRLDAEVRDLATACELVHAATLLHDDVIDEGTERRGVPTARVVFSNSASVLAGDHLLLHALKLAEGVGFRRLVSELLDTISAMVASEAIQLERRGRFEPDREIYMSIIRGKTAGLFRWGLMAGGTVGGLSDDAVHALARTGEAVGLAFQLVDDVLDLEGDSEQTGKDLYVDLREGKLTWPLIIAAEEDPWVLNMAKEFASGEGNADVGPLLERLRKSGALEKTREFAKRQSERALAELEMLPSGQARRSIELVVEAAVQRRS